MQASGQTIILKLQLLLIIFGQPSDFFVYVTKSGAKLLRHFVSSNDIAIQTQTKKEGVCVTCY